MKKKTEKQRIGAIGEDIAVRFLVKHGYTVICRNYRKKFGEIDVICEKLDKTHFFEVKTVSRENISRETPNEHRPEENIHETKLRRIGRTIEAYLSEQSTDKDWEFHAIIVKLNEKQKKARVVMLKDLAI